MELAGEGRGAAPLGVSDYRIVVHRSDKVVRQRFYVTIIAANGEPLWTSEMFRDKDYAIEFANRWAAITDGNMIDETGGTT